MLNNNYIRTEQVQQMCQYHYILGQIILNWTQNQEVSNIFLVNQTQKKQLLTNSKVTQIKNYFEHILYNDFFQNIEVKHEDIELMQLLQIKTMFIIFQILLQQNSLINTHYDLKLNITQYLLKKHAIQNYSIKLLTETCLMSIVYQQFHDDNQQQKKQKITIQNFLQMFSSSIVNRNLNELQCLHILQDKESPFNILNELFITYGGFQYLENEISNVINVMNNSFDHYYLQSQHFFIPLYLEFFKNFMLFWNENTEPLPKQIDSLENEEIQKKNEKKDVNKQFKITNIIRQLILRIKPLILSKNKIYSVNSLIIFKQSIPLLYNKSMEVDKGNTNFSTNDPANVQIPDALGPITFELLDTFKFILKNCAVNGSKKLAVGIYITDILKEILSFQKTYAFLMPNTFDKDLLPLFINILQVYKNNTTNSHLLKIITNIIQFLVLYKDLYKENNYQFSEEILDQISDFSKLILQQIEKSEKQGNISQIYTKNLQLNLDLVSQLL